MIPPDSDQLKQSAGPVLLIAPHGSYRTAPFIHAAQQMGIKVLVASQGQYSIVSDYARGIHIDFSAMDAALQTLLQVAQQQQVCAVIGTDDLSTGLAAQVCDALQVPHNPSQAVEIARRKDLARDRLEQAGIQKPRHYMLDRQQANESQLPLFGFPVVVKPLALSASRGVIRADDPESFFEAVTRCGRIVDAETHLENEAKRFLLVESFVPGVEVAVEGMLYAGKLQVLAVFDKPDPLDGPVFEETYYITPSSHSADIQQALAESVQAACHAYGLCEGPVHAECRINEQGVWILEVAARTIGGLCGRLIELGTGYNLEQLVLLHALGKRTQLPKQQQAVGVLMMPTPGAGVLKRVEGMLDAQRVPFIEEISIQVNEGYELVPLPEGSSYLGFMFARADNVQQVEQALREAHARLKFILAPVWKAQVA